MDINISSGNINFVVNMQKKKNKKKLGRINQETQQKYLYTKQKAYIVH